MVTRQWRPEQCQGHRMLQTMHTECRKSWEGRPKACISCHAKCGVARAVTTTSAVMTEVDNLEEGKTREELVGRRDFMDISLVDTENWSQTSSAVRHDRSERSPNAVFRSPSSVGKSGEISGTPTLHESAKIPRQRRRHVHAAYVRCRDHAGCVTNQRSVSGGITEDSMIKSYSRARCGQSIVRRSRGFTKCQLCFHRRCKDNAPIPCSQRHAQRKTAGPTDTTRPTILLQVLTGKQGRAGTEHG